MKILIAPGDTLIVGLLDNDGEFTVKLGDNALTVEADMPDSDGREGVIYSERFGETPRDKKGDLLPTVEHEVAGFVLSQPSTQFFCVCEPRQRARNGKCTKCKKDVR